MNELALARPTFFRSLGLALPKRDPWAIAMIGVVGFLSLIILSVPVIVIILSLREGRPVDPESAYSLMHFRDVFSDPVAYRALLNTFGFSAVTLLVAFVFGLPAAWLAERTDLPGKPVLYTLMTLGILLPGFATAMGWLFLLHPRIGLLNTFLTRVVGLSEAPFNVASIVGMGWVQGLSLAPIAFIMTAAVLRAIDPALEESAQMSGAGFHQIIRRVTLRLAFPGILAAGIYILTIGFAAFDVPAIIGMSNRIFTFSTYLLTQLQPNNDLPHYGKAAALSTVIMAISGLLALWYGRLQSQAHRFQVVTGKGYRPRLVPLGKYAWLAWVLLGLYFTMSKLMPLLLLVWAASLPYFQLPSATSFATMSWANFQNIPWNMMMEGLRNTSILMVLTPTVTLACAVAFSWVVLRSKIPGRLAFDFVAFLPHAIPNIVFGVGVLLLALFLLRNWVPFFGTMWILLFVFVIGRISYATRMTNSTLIQIHKELEEAATMSGVATGTVVRRVLLPLLAPTIAYAWIWIALLTFRELTLAVILTTRDNLTLPVVVWGMWFSGDFGVASATTLLLIAMMVPFIAVYWFCVRKTGLRAT
jgi:iron(III) transport system permease protein